jgi:exodeoxyribonuclease-3
MKIATWNVNSLSVRLPQVLDWLAANPTEVLALQELKLTDDKFPVAAFTEAGYQAQWFGQKTYNGVALISKAEGSEVVKNIPGFEDDLSRVIAATYPDGAVGTVRVIGAYFPNGQAPDSDKFVYKMRWLDALRATGCKARCKSTRIWCSRATSTSPLTNSTCGTRWA